MEKNNHKAWADQCESHAAQLKAMQMAALTEMELAPFDDQLKAILNVQKNGKNQVVFSRGVSEISGSVIMAL
jgi:hypothetical protein